MEKNPKESSKARKPSLLIILFSILMIISACSNLFFIFSYEKYLRKEKNNLRIQVEWKAEDLYGKIIRDVPTICYRKKGIAIEVYELTFNRFTLQKGYADSVKSFINHHLPLYHPFSFPLKEKWEKINKENKVGGLIVSIAEYKEGNVAKLYVCFSKGVSEKELFKSLRCFDMDRIYIQHIETFEFMPSFGTPLKKNDLKSLYLA